MPSSPPRVIRSPLFATTHWSQVAAALDESSQDSAAALEAICAAYWHPLYVYVRRSGYSPHDAQDLTQDFFRSLLEKRWLESADRERGRLRTFLIVALKNFIAKEWRRASAQRRGGSSPHFPMDTSLVESGLAREVEGTLTLDEAYDRQWALVLLERTLGRLQQEFEAMERGADFETLKGCLMTARGAIDYGAVAAQLDVSEGAARVAVHRLRKRFREAYREEIARTLEPGTDLDEEMRYLAAALARG